MRTFNDESVIIEFFQNIKTNEILILGNENNCVNILNTILNTEKWKEWIDSSKKDQTPPDFYNNRENIMMEVMRIDDHAYVNKKNKVINPQLQQENKVKDMLLNNINFSNLNKNTVFFLNVCTNLPTEEDHNYIRYKNNFKRVINKHKNQIENYKKNHPNYKLIFFVFDESAAYIEAANKKEKVSNLPLGRPHLHFLDKDFITTIDECNVDYIIWYAPFKRIKNFPVAYPKVAIYDKTMKINEKLYFNYKEELMVSSEI